MLFARSTPREGAKVVSSMVGRCDVLVGAGQGGGQSGAASVTEIEAHRAPFGASRESDDTNVIRDLRVFIELKHCRPARRPPEQAKEAGCRSPRHCWRLPFSPVPLVPVAAARAQGQRVDAEYTAKIKEYLQDSRITTELVDHLPASSTVPTPLKFLGRVVGHAGRADLRQGHPALFRGARQGVSPDHHLEDRDHRGRPRHRAAGGGGRGHDQEPREVQGDAECAHRSRGRPPRSRPGR